MCLLEALFYEGCNCICEGPVLASRCSRRPPHLLQNADGTYHQTFQCPKTHVRKHLEPGHCTSHERTYMLQSLLKEEREKRRDEEACKLDKLADEYGVFAGVGSMRA